MLIQMIFAGSLRRFFVYIRVWVFVENAYYIAGLKCGIII